MLAAGMRVSPVLRNVSMPEDRDMWGPAPKPGTRPGTKPATKPDAKPVPKPAPKPATKPDATKQGGSSSYDNVSPLPFA